MGPVVLVIVVTFVLLTPKLAAAPPGHVPVILMAPFTVEILPDVPMRFTPALEPELDPEVPFRVIVPLPVVLSPGVEATAIN